MKVYGQLESAQAENLSSDPSVTPRGRFYFHTTLLIEKVYNSLGWVTRVGRRVSGTRASPIAVTAAAGITPLADGTDQLHFIQGDLGGTPTPITIAANPAIAAGVLVGQKLTLKGRSDTNYVVVPNGLGTSQNGDWFGGQDDSITYSWDGTNWSEDSRR